jgi:aryl-alcohol dehydrogenase-like predicted oxidoreductase
MNYIKIGEGERELNISVIGFGCMSLTPDFYKPLDGDSSDEPFDVLKRAYELGVNLWDTADIYDFGDNEKLIARCWTEIPRNKIVLATKCGILRDKTDHRKRGVSNSTSYVLEACEKSLARLQTKYLDIFYLHRKDPQTSIDVPMQAMQKLVAQKKIRHIVLCEVDAETLRAACSIHPVSFVQIEYSLLTREPEHEFLSVCKELGVTVVAYSPISRGLLTGTFDGSSVFSDGDSRKVLPRFTAENLTNNIKVAQKIKILADRKRCSVAQLSLAYLLHRQTYIIPIPGTKSIRHLEDNAGSVDVRLEAKDILELEKLAPIGIAKGTRYTAAAMEKFKFGW